MAIKVLGGLTAENFVETIEETNRQKINIQKILFEEDFTQGIQIRVGHEFTNGLPIKILVEKINSLNIPYIVHGPAENFGVDLGECIDEGKKFQSYNLAFPDVNRSEFNQKAISNAALATAGENNLDSRIILHPGYSPDFKLNKDYLNKIQKILQEKMSNIPFSLETIPSLVINKDLKITNYGFGGIPKEMKELLEETVNQDGSVLIDFTHVGVTANQMNKLSDFFDTPQSYEKIN